MVNQWSKFIQPFLPRHCILCGDDTTSTSDLCQACLEDLPWIRHGCAHCGVAIHPKAELCSHCQKQTPVYDLCLAPLQYRYPLDYLVRRFKFHQDLVCGRTLTAILAEYLAHARELPPPDLIIPVPLHRDRLRERGFNQAWLLARELAGHFQCPCPQELVIRKRATRAQSQLPAQQRHRNVRRAFAVTADVRAAHIALVDDVVTTGATVNEISRQLKRGGAEHVEVWAVARS